MIVEKADGTVIRHASVLFAYDSNAQTHLMFVITNDGATIVEMNIGNKPRFAMAKWNPDEFQEFIDSMMQTMPGPFFKIVQDEWQIVCKEYEPQ